MSCRIKIRLYLSLTQVGKVTGKVRRNTGSPETVI